MDELREKIATTVEKWYWSTPTHRDSQGYLVADEILALLEPDTRLRVHTIEEVPTPDGFGYVRESRKPTMAELVQIAERAFELSVIYQRPTMTYNNVLRKNQDLNTAFGKLLTLPAGRVTMEGNQ